MSHDELPNRKARRRSHVPPSWVEPHAVFFITINCQERGKKELTAGKTPLVILDSIRHHVKQGKWWPELVLLMPDHLHMLVSFRFETVDSPAPTIEQWKRFLARTSGIRWQRDFFDHRIRNAADHQDKRGYLLNNPERAGLVESDGQWPYVWTEDDWREAGKG
jgi:REP element-mobilizing transposase RayT